MITLSEFLLSSNIKGGTFALVTYANKTIPVWFKRYTSDKGDWFLESPCELLRIIQVEESIEDFCKKYIQDCIDLDEDTDEETYINKFVKPMIVDGWLYEVENFQCSPYLPKEVDNVEIITEKECLLYMLQSSYAKLLNVR